MRFIGSTPVKSLIAASICSATIFSLAFLGCAGNAAITTADKSNVSENNLKQISQVAVSEDEKSVLLSITGSSDLLFSDIRRTAPPEVTFYFPSTQLVGVQDQYDVGVDPVKQISTSAVVADGQTAKVTVSLNNDAVYSIEQSEQGLSIAFSKEAVVEETAQAESAPEKTTASITDEVAAISAAPKGTCIETVDVEKRSDGVDVLISADGKIQDYTAFTIDNPPRIVFDIFNIDSPYKGLQKVVVDSKWVTGLRHFCYPDKLRLVLDTDRAYMTSFSSKPTKNGLIISVSEKQPILREDLIVPAAVEQVAANETAAVQEDPGDIPQEQNPAWLNKIEFTGAEGGESLVTIGTTNAVRYDMQKVGERKLQLELFDTRVPQYRKRPLITTRFESAVDRVTPVQTPQMGNTAVIVFELRESVPYEIEQDDNFIFVRFAPSTVPPKPMEATQEPEWKKALKEGESDQADMASVAAGGGPEDAMTEAGPAAAEPTKGLTEASKKWGTASEVLMDEGNIVKRVDETILSKKKDYTGEKIALNFYDTDIKNVFRILGEISGKNFAIDKDVTGKVTLNFETPVPWDQVLDLVLRMNQLGMKEDQGIYRIATQATLAREAKLESAKLEAARKKDEEEDLVTEFFLCSYINARDTACAHLARNCSAPNSVGWDSKFSPRGSISVDVDKNMIIVNDIPKAVERIREIIRILDQVTPQVLIEARIVEANTNFTRDIGFDWGNVSIGSFSLGDVFQVTGIDMTADNIPATALDNGAIGFGLSKLSGTSFDIIDARLQLGEAEGKTRIISAPKILTLDGKQAVIKQGFEIAYLERDSAGGSSVKFKNVDLELRVRPKVTPDNRVMMAVQVQKDDVTDLAIENPPLSTNQANTELLMEDGETIVIGGIIKATVSEGEQGIPGLRKIPGLGLLFKYGTKTDQQNELLIFLTPKIVKLAQKEVQSTKF
jgi:type IV pilus assembly protein PilQ